MTEEKKKERLKPQSFYGYSLEDVLRAVMHVDPKPLWEEEKRERERKARKKKEIEGPKQEELFE
jgi:hypothetical protein